MFDFDFAYTKTMQAILFFVSCGTTIVFYTYVTNLILLIYGEKVRFWHKATYILLTGTLMNNLWTYGIYFFGGMLDFPPIVYNLVTVPNPVFALIFFFLGIKILHLSPYRSVRLLTNAYLFVMVIKMFQRMIGFIFFPQPGDPWNYLTDCASLVVCTFLFTIIYFVMRQFVLKSNFSIRLAENIQARHFGKEVLLLIIKASIVYIFSVFYPLYANTNKSLYLFVTLIIMTFMLVVSFLLDYIGSQATELSNKAVHTKRQNETIDGYSSFRHDLNNILQSIGGYIEIGDIEKLREYHNSLFNATVSLNENALLNKKMVENPTLISLLISKLEFAEAEQVNLRIDIAIDINDLYIDELDLCRAIGNLLDNAIEAAKISSKKLVNFSINGKKDGSKLIVISNSTKDIVDISAINRPGITSKKNHSGMGLNHTRKILSKYSNCILQLAYYDLEFTAYISITSR